MAFERIEPSQRQHDTGAFLTLNKTYMNLHAITRSFLGDADRVHVYYDSDTQQIAIEPTSVGGHKVTLNRSNAQISALALQRRIGNKRGTYAVERRDGRLVFDLSQPVG